jgi:hypothetical protein
MFRTVLSIIVSSLLLSVGALWAEGGKNRHGQDGTQPRVRDAQTMETESAAQSREKSRFQKRETPAQNRLRKQTSTEEADQNQIRNSAGDQDQDRTRTRDRKRDGSCETARKQIRDRKRDGSCLAADRTRTRSQRRTGTC